MPVAFLIHGRKKEKVHARFFDFVSSVFPKLDRKCVPFVTDRGTALVNAIDKNFPNCDVIMCWNHLINDFKFSLQKMGADHTNIAVYVTNIKELLRCNSEEEYKPIVSYFQKMKKNILKHCGKWVIDKYQHLYDPLSGVTNNPCESINAVIKRFSKFKKLPVDCFELSMFYLQNYYITEFQRGLAGIGNVQLKTEFLHARIPKDEICIPKHVNKPEDIVKHVMAEIDCVREDCVKESMEQPSEAVQFSEQQESVPPIEQPLETVPSSEQQKESVPSSELSSSSENEPSKDTESLKETLDIDKSLSQKSLARLTVENDNVSFVQQQKAFMVTGTQ
jgi:hypothetical protein